jgi:hydroxymethylpyrimidine/phosphomethylpyrimidine kinase
MTRPVALTIAGSDSSGGAGIQADLKTFSALGVYGASVVTALTAQNTQGVQDVQLVSADFVTAQITSVASDLQIGAVKTGMLGDVATVHAVVDSVRRYNLRPLVVDPVMVATSGDRLLDADASGELRRCLAPLADLLTPNLAEAAFLLGAPVAANEEEQQTQAQALLKLGCGAVLLKGGHGKGANAVDYLASAGGVERLARRRIATRNTHGTGCTLSAAIAAHVARGLPLADAVREGTAFVWSALESGRDLGIGSGAGPVDHLFGVPKQ